ncbi:MAG TPA: SpoIIE family protein phosphatase [Thermoleophilaceae bacterium]
MNRDGRQDLWWLGVALILDALLVAGDVAIGPLTATLMVPPFLLAVAARPRVVALGGLISFLLALPSAFWNDGVDNAYFARVGMVALGVALAYYAAVRRCRSEFGARRLESLAAIGDVVSVSPTAVVGVDAAGIVTLFNPTAEETFGHRAEDAVGRDLGDLVVPPDLRDTYRRALASLGAGGESPYIGRRLETKALRSDGTTFPVAVTIARVPGAGPQAFAGFVRDITDQQRAETAQRLRARIAELLATASDYEGTLRAAVGLPVPELADWCWIDLPDPRGRIRAAADSRFGGRPPHGRAPSTPEEAAAPNPRGLERVIETGVPALHPKVSRATLAEYAHSTGHLAQMEELGVASLVVVPLRAGRRTLGSMAFAATGERCFGEEDVQLADELARRVGNAVDNARLYEERARTAATLMASLRPPAIPDLPGWKTAALYAPAGRTDEVGGDFYDVFATRDGWMLVIGDVVGHGPPAAALTSLARYSIRAAATLTGSAAPALEHLNDQLRQDGRLALLSAGCVLLTRSGDRAFATIAVAGHPRPVLVRNGEPRLVGRTSLVLGADDDVEYLEDRIEIEPGDCLVLYTDGVLDATGERDRFGDDRLLAALAGDAPTPDLRLQRLSGALKEFQVGAQRDDIAVLAAQRVSTGDAEEALRVPSRASNPSSRV